MLDINCAYAFFLLVRSNREMCTKEKRRSQTDEEENKRKEEEVGCFVSKRLVDIYDPEFQVGKKEFWGRAGERKRSAG
jgi:hypothetical protein